MTEILDIKLVQLCSRYVNDITDMHVIYYITCLSDIVWGFCSAVSKDRSRDYNDRHMGVMSIGTLICDSEANTYRDISNNDASCNAF